MIALLLGVLILIILVGFGLLFFVFNQKIGELKNDSGVGLLKQDLQSMSSAMSQTQAHMSDRLDKAAAVFGGLQNELGKMQELGRSIRDIQDVLKSPKLRGNIGEQMMADLIAQQIPKASYSLQYAFRSGVKVDAVIKTKSGLISIDAKFSAVNYIKYVQAKDEVEKQAAKKLFISDVKKQIDDIAKKYIAQTEGTVDFALMYVPGEAAYYFVMTETELFDYASGLRVYLVSPQTFNYFLKTVLVSLEGELIEAKAREVMTYLKGIQTDSRKFGDELGLVHKHLNNAKNAMDTASASYGRLGSKIESANQLGTATTESATKPIAEPTPELDRNPLLDPVEAVRDNESQKASLL